MNRLFFREPWYQTILDDGEETQEVFSPFSTPGDARVYAKRLCELYEKVRVEIRLFGCYVVDTVTSSAVR